MAEVKVIASPTSWIEGEAVRQLEKTAELPDMVRAIGMPDLHPGQSCPVGAVFVTEGRIFPHLIGSDIGCGMGLWKTTIQQLRPERLEKKLKGLEDGIDNPLEWLASAGVEPTGYEHSLGTIGRGNHFAELLIPDEIMEPEAVDALIGDDRRRVLLLVHSGSRGYGEKILYAHTAEFQDKGLVPGTDAFHTYWDDHNHAMEWAKVNRRVIAERMLDMLGAQGEQLFDNVHNFMEPSIGYMNPNLQYLHRKGAIPVQFGHPMVIPGSRGAHSYLVAAGKTHQEDTGWSVSHGAGRKMSRHDAIQKLKRGTRQSQTDSTDKLKRTKFGSLVICEDKQLLMEENPEAYKPIAQVIQDLVDHKLIKVLATLKPILTYKMRRTDADPHYGR